MKSAWGRKGFAGQLSEGPAEDGCAWAPRREGGARKPDLGLGVVTLGVVMNLAWSPRLPGEMFSPESTVC